MAAAADRSGRTSSQASATAEDERYARRARAVLIALVAAYVAGLVALYALGLFGFVWKTLVVPALFIVAYAAKRLGVFVRDWAVFLGAIVLFDSARGLVYVLVLRTPLPVHMGYVIRLEQALFGRPVPSVRLQRALFPGVEIGWLQQLLVTLHASHFLVFLFFGLLVWLVRQPFFGRFKLAMVIVMYAAVALYLVVPTVPPWMAASRFFVLDPIDHVPARVYNLATPELAASFDVNPIAAMPSLHAAFPLLLTLICFEHFGAWGFAMLGYTLAILFAIVALGEHYVVDVLAGGALSLLAYLVAYRWPAVAALLDRRARAPMPPLPRAGILGEALRLWRPLSLSAVLLVLGQVTGLAALGLQQRDVPTEEFITRELDGKSPMATYYRGLNAYYRSDFARAKHLFAKALLEVPDVKKQARTYVLLGESSYFDRDWQRAIHALSSQPALAPHQRLMLAEARLRVGQRELAFSELDMLAASVPGNAEVQARKRRLELEFGRGSGPGRVVR
jgi:hypothetical protein